MSVEDEKLNGPVRGASWGRCATQANSGSALEQVNVRRLLNIVERDVGTLLGGASLLDADVPRIQSAVTTYLDHAVNKQLIRPDHEVQTTKVTGWLLSLGQYPVVIQSWSDGTTTYHGRRFRGSRRRLRVWARAHANDVVANVYIRPVDASNTLTVTLRSGSHHD